MKAVAVFKAASAILGTASSVRNLVDSLPVTSKRTHRRTLTYAPTHAPTHANVCPIVRLDVTTLKPRDSVHRASRDIRSLTEFRAQADLGSVRPGETVATRIRAIFGR